MASPNLIASVLQSSNVKKVENDEMKLSDTFTFNPSVTSSQSEELSKKSFPQKPKTTRPKLSRIWVKEFDGERQRLVAKWTTQD